MAIENPIKKAEAGVKKVPKKAWIVIGATAIVLVLWRMRASDEPDDGTDGVDSYGDDGTPMDAVSLQGSPAYDTIPGVYPLGGGQGALPPVEFPDAVEGLPAFDEGSVSVPGGGQVTLNIVASQAPEGASGNDVTPGPTTTSNATKTVTTRRIKTLADLPYATRQKIREERKAGNVDRFGRTPTERKAARDNPGIAGQIRNRIKKTRAGGGAPKKKHPSKVHGNALRHPRRKRESPKAHIKQPKRSRPVQQPNPRKKRRARSRH